MDDGRQTTDDASVKLPRGKAIEWSLLDILELSTPTPEDIRRAREYFHAHAPAPYKGLIDARSDTPNPDAGGTNDDTNRNTR